MNAQDAISSLPIGSAITIIALNVPATSYIHLGDGVFWCVENSEDIGYFSERSEVIIQIPKYLRLEKVGKND